MLSGLEPVLFPRKAFSETPTILWLPGFDGTAVALTDSGPFKAGVTHLVKSEKGDHEGRQNSSWVVCACQAD